MRVIAVSDRYSKASSPNILLVCQVLLHSNQAAKKYFRSHVRVRNSDSHGFLKWNMLQDFLREGSGEMLMFQGVAWWEHITLGFHRSHMDVVMNHGPPRSSAGAVILCGVAGGLLKFPGPLSCSSTPFVLAEFESPCMQFKLCVVVV